MRECSFRFFRSDFLAFFLINWLCSKDLSRVRQFVSFSAHKVFVQNLVAQVLVIFLKSAKLRHHTAHAFSKYLPFFLALLTMRLVEEVIWFEWWENHNLASISAVHVHQTRVHDKRHALPTRAETTPSILHNNWLHGVKASESPFLE